MLDLARGHARAPASVLPESAVDSNPAASSPGMATGSATLATQTEGQRGPRGRGGKGAECSSRRYGSVCRAGTFLGTAARACFSSPNKFLLRNNKKRKSASFPPLPRGPCSPFRHCSLPERPLELKVSDGTIRRAEMHWYEATGIGRYEFKIKRYLD
jgi:hypothetical protein